MPRVAHARHGDQSDTNRARHGCTETHSTPSQGHPLSLPVRQSPRERQRELLPPHVLLGLRLGLDAEDRHPATSVNHTPASVREHLDDVLEEAPSLHHTRTPVRTLCQLVQPHVIELDNHTKRCPLLRIRRRRVPSLRPDEAFHGSHGTVHKSRLDPQVSRQQNTRFFAELQL